MKSRIQDAFEPIKAEESLKRKTLAKIEKRHRPVARKLQRRLAFAMVMLLAVMSFGGYRVYNTPVDIISIDINPSVELNLNRFERVISWKSFEPQSESILEGLSLRHQNYEDAVGNILKSGFIESRGSEIPYVHLSIASGSERRQERMMQTLEQKYTADSELLVDCSDASMENLGEAHRYGMSLGKYSSFLSLKEEGEEITVEEVKDMEMREIRERMQERSGGGEGSPQRRQKGK